MSYIFGTLMWIDEENHSCPNSSNLNICSYFMQILLLSNTLRSKFGAELFVFTNNVEMIEQWFKNKNTSVKFFKIFPSFQVTPGLRFFGAHYKLDALIAGLKMLRDKDDRFFLLDSDVIANYNFSDEQIRMIGNADLVVYDISDQVYPTYGAAKIIADVELVSGDFCIDPKWFGGEFIAGSKLGLSRLVEKIRDILPRYFENISTLHHVGDEMFITSSINSLLNESVPVKILIQNPYRLVSRHWARFTDRPLYFHMQHNFIHCPGSKRVLEILSNFKEPSSLFIHICLKLYQIRVLFASSCRNFGLQRFMSFLHKY